MAILKIPRAKNLNGELVAQKCKGMTMSISGGNSIQSIAFRMTGIEGYIPVRRGDLYYYNIGQDISPEEFGLLNTSGLDPHVYSKTIKTDNDAYGAYIFWGDEQLKRPNAQIAAFVRQSVQNTQALIAGHLSRSKYSSSEEMAGNLFAGLASDAINSFMDYLMVSTERIFSIETVLQVVNPNELKAKTYLQIVISKSNEQEPHKFNFVFESTYYRWNCPEEVTFMGPFKVKDAEASAMNLGGIVTLVELPKDKQKLKENEVNEFCKHWKATYKNEVKALKASADAMPKGPEKDLAKHKVKEYKKIRQQCWADYNEQMYLQLKNKSNNYKP